MGNVFWQTFEKLWHTATSRSKYRVNPYYTCPQGVNVTRHNDYSWWHRCRWSGCLSNNAHSIIDETRLDHWARKLQRLASSDLKIILPKNTFSWLTAVLSISAGLLDECFGLRLGTTSHSHSFRRMWQWSPARHFCAEFGMESHKLEDILRMVARFLRAALLVSLRIGLFNITLRRCTLIYNFLGFALLTQFSLLSRTQCCIWNLLWTTPTTNTKWPSPMNGAEGRKPKAKPKLKYTGKSNLALPLQKTKDHELERTLETKLKFGKTCKKNLI